MEITLNTLLNTCIIVPYDNDTIDRLTKICNIYIDRHDNVDDLSNLTICLFSKKWSEEFHIELESIYLELYGTEIKLPKCTLKAFATYIINGILDNHEDDGTYALSVMNCMILLNGHLNDTPYPDVFMTHMNTFQNYFKENCELDEENVEEIFSTVFPSFKEGHDELEDISTEDLTEVDSSLRSLLRDAWYHRTLQYVHKEKKQAKETGNPYSWVFHTIYHIIENMPWLFINNNVRHLIMEVTSDTKEEESLLVKEIIELIDIDTDNIILDSPHQSSIILRLLKHDSALEGVNLNKTTLSIKQFATYLYFELLLEKAMN